MKVFLELNRCFDGLLRPMEKLRNGALNVLVAIVIIVMAGPEILVATEMYALVELFGVTTFLSMYLIFVKYTVIDFLSKFEIDGFGGVSFSDVKNEPQFLPMFLPINSFLYILLLGGPIAVMLATYLPI